MTAKTTLKKMAAAAKTAIKDVNVIAILDMSGSMSGIEDDTRGGFNAFVKEAQADQDAEGGRVTLSLTCFDTTFIQVYRPHRHPAGQADRACGVHATRQHGSARRDRDDDRGVRDRRCRQEHHLGQRHSRGIRGGFGRATTDSYRALRAGGSVREAVDALYDSDDSTLINRGVARRGDPASKTTPVTTRTGAGGASKGRKSLRQLRRS